MKSFSSHSKPILAVGLASIFPSLLLPSISESRFSTLIKNQPGKILTDSTGSYVLIIKDSHLPSPNARPKFLNNNFFLLDKKMGWNALQLKTSMRNDASRDEGFHSRSFRSGLTYASFNNRIFIGDSAGKVIKLGRQFSLKEAEALEDKIEYKPIPARSVLLFEGELIDKRKIRVFIDIPSEADRIFQDTNSRRNPYRVIMSGDKGDITLKVIDGYRLADGGTTFIKTNEGSFVWPQQINKKNPPPTWEQEGGKKQLISYKPIKPLFVEDAPSFKLLHSATADVVFDLKKSMHNSPPKGLGDSIIRELPSLFARKPVTSLSNVDQRFTEDLAIIRNVEFEIVRVVGGKIYYRKTQLYSGIKQNSNPWIDLKTGHKKK